MTYYNTNVDGRGYVESEITLEKNLLVMIDDNIYNEDREVFKVQNVNGCNVDMKFQKSLSLVANADGNYQIEDVTYEFEGRLSKNQMLLLGDRLGVVESIEKRKGEPDVVHLDWKDVHVVKSKYRVYKRASGGPEEVQGLYESFGEAFGALMNLRMFAKEDVYYRM